MNKGVDDAVAMRPRFVARDFRKKGESERFDLFAAMPPFELKRMLSQMAVRKNWEHPERKYKLLFLGSSWV